MMDKTAALQQIKSALESRVKGIKVNLPNGCLRLKYTYHKHFSLVAQSGTNYLTDDLYLPMAWWIECPLISHVAALVKHQPLTPIYLKDIPTLTLQEAVGIDQLHQKHIQVSSAAQLAEAITEPCELTERAIEIAAPYTSFEAIDRFYNQNWYSNQTDYFNQAGAPAGCISAWLISNPKWPQILDYHTQSAVLPFEVEMMRILRHLMTTYTPEKLLTDYIAIVKHEQSVQKDESLVSGFDQNGEPLIQPQPDQELMVYFHFMPPQCGRKELAPAHPYWDQFERVISHDLGVEVFRKSENQFLIRNYDQKLPLQIKNWLTHFWENHPEAPR